MSTWHVDVPKRLGEEFGHLSPAARRAVHDLFDVLAQDPRAGAAEPVSGAEIRRMMTAPTTDTGDRISVLYRVHDDEDPGRVEIIWILAGP